MSHQYFCTNTMKHSSTVEQTRIIRQLISFFCFAKPAKVKISWHIQLASRHAYVSTRMYSRTDRWNRTTEYANISLVLTKNRHGQRAINIWPMNCSQNYTPAMKLTRWCGDESDEMKRRHIQATQKIINTIEKTCSSSLWTTVAFKGVWIYRSKRHLLPGGTVCYTSHTPTTWFA